MEKFEALMKKSLKSKEILTGIYPSNTLSTEWIKNDQTYKKICGTDTSVIWKKTFNERKCVVKIEDYKSAFYQEVISSSKMQNILYEKGYAPKIYFCIYLTEYKTVVLFMDYVSGSPIDDLLLYNEFDIFLELCGNIFGENTELYHGDFNPKNILYNADSKKFMFIDFTYRDVDKFGKKYYHFYDYICMLFFIPAYVDKDNLKIVVDKLLTQAKKMSIDDTIELVEQICNSFIDYKEDLLKLGQVIKWVYRDDYTTFRDELIKMLENN